MCIASNLPLLPNREGSPENGKNQPEPESWQPSPVSEAARILYPDLDEPETPPPAPPAFSLAALSQPPASVKNRSGWTLANLNRLKKPRPPASRHPAILSRMDSGLKTPEKKPPMQRV